MRHCKQEIKTPGHGLYKVYWRAGGSSLAAIGSDRRGRRWIAPTNWTSTGMLDDHLEQIAELVPVNPENNTSPRGDE